MVHRRERPAQSDSVSLLETLHLRDQKDTFEWLLRMIHQLAVLLRVLFGLDL